MVILSFAEDPICPRCASVLKSDTAGVSFLHHEKMVLMEDHFLHSEEMVPLEYHFCICRS
jgi:hypothetical protein